MDSFDEWKTPILTFSHFLPKQSHSFAGLALHPVHLKFGGAASICSELLHPEDQYPLHEETYPGPVLRHILIECPPPSKQTKFLSGI